MKCANVFGLDLEEDIEYGVSMRKKILESSDVPDAATIMKFVKNSADTDHNLVKFLKAMTVGKLDNSYITHSSRNMQICNLFRSS